MGETDLRVLLTSMSPELHPRTYVFCTFPDALPDGLSPLMTFHEAEGVTAILEQAQADRLGVASAFPSAWITLTVFSSLSAVGLTAAVAMALADYRISCNMVAAYHHDHLFVPVDQAERALAALRELSEAAAFAHRLSQEGE